MKMAYSRISRFPNARSGKLALVISKLKNKRAKVKTKKIPMAPPTYSKNFLVLYGIL
jgi:hypothetical protein